MAIANANKSAMLISPSITYVYLTSNKKDNKPSAILPDVSKLNTLLNIMDFNDLMAKNDVFHHTHSVPLTIHMHTLKLMEKADLLYRAQLMSQFSHWKSCKNKPTPALGSGVGTEEFIHCCRIHGLFQLYPNEYQTP